jgi:hypothetical protein
LTYVYLTVKINASSGILNDLRKAAISTSVF